MCVPVPKTYERKIHQDTTCQPEQLLRETLGVLLEDAKVQDAIETFW